MVKNLNESGWADEPVDKLDWDTLQELARKQYPAFRFGKLHLKLWHNKQMINSGVLQCAKRYKTKTDGYSHGVYVIVDEDKLWAKLSEYHAWLEPRIKPVDPNEPIVVEVEQFLR